MEVNNIKDITKGYKGYNSNFSCRPAKNTYRYAENTIYELPKDEKIKCGMSGFHYCLNPLDVIDFYPLIGNDGELNTFTEIKALGNVYVDDENDKIFTTDKIEIFDKLDIDGYIGECVRYMEEICGSGDDEDYLNIIESDDDLKISENSYNAKIITSGDNNQILSNGLCSNIITGGDDSQIVINGNNSQAIIRGDNSRIVISSELSSVIINGNFTKTISNGSKDKVISRGIYNQIVSSGDKTFIVSNGYFSSIVTTGDNLTVIVNGNYSKINVQGSDSIVENFGIDGMIKGVIGTRITLIEYDKDKDYSYVKSSIIDGEKIKENTWYTLKNKKFVKCGGNMQW